LCYRELKCAGETMDALVERLSEEACRAIGSIRLAEARDKAVIIYPYWVGVIFKSEWLRTVDEWLCRARHPSPEEVCAGRARLREFLTLADEVKRVDF